MFTCFEEKKTYRKIFPNFFFHEKKLFHKILKLSFEFFQKRWPGSKWQSTINNMKMCIQKKKEKKNNTA